MLISDIANQFSESQIHDQCAESTVGQICNPLPKSPGIQQVLEPVQIANVEKPGDQVSLSVSACASTAREKEPPMYTPLTATWSLCTSTYRPDDNPGILFNHPGKKIF